MSQRPAPSSGLLPLRPAFVLLLALLAAGAAGLAVLGGRIRFFDWLIS